MREKIANSPDTFFFRRFVAKSRLTKGAGAEPSGGCGFARRAQGCALPIENRKCVMLSSFTRVGMCVGHHAWDI